VAGTMTLTRLLVAIANLEGDTALHAATLQLCPATLPTVGSADLQADPDGSVADGPDRISP
jgi:hypothetical protein